MSRLLLTCLLLATSACDIIPPPRVELDGGDRWIAPQPADAAPELPVRDRPPERAGGTVISPPDECPEPTDPAHCDVCWLWDSGPTSLDRNEVNDAFGDGLAIGDFNDDGFPDAAVGAAGEDIDGVSNVGRIYVYLGSERGFQPWRVLSSTDFGVTEAANNALGVELAAGDFDDDGYADLAAAFGGIPGSVATIIVAYGEPEGFRDHTVFELSDIDPSMRTDVIHLGHALSVGDYDDDGIDDLAVGAEEYPLAGRANAGAVFILDGGWGSGLALGSRVDLDDGLIGALAQDRFGGSLATHRQSAEDFLVVGMPGYGWVLTYEGGVYGGPYSNGSYPNFGTRVAVGDLNGDGAPDPLASGSSGSSIVVVGTSNVIASFSPSGASSIHPLAVGDVDGDGNDDVLAVSNASGHHLLLYEGDGTLVPDPWVELDPADRQHANDALGLAALLVDIDGDEALDVVAGAAVPSVGAGAGRLYSWAVSDPLDWSTNPAPVQVIDQNTSFSACLDWTSPAECAHVSEGTHCERCWAWEDGGPASLDRNQTVEYFGYATAVGDFNGDGFPDLAAGSPFQSRGGLTDAGSVFVYLGSERGFQPWLTLDDEDAAGPTTGAYFGVSLHAADLNGDGMDDLLVGSFGVTTDTPTYLFVGSAAGLTLAWTLRMSDLDSTSPTPSGTDLGSAWATGDFDHDGDTDVAVSAPSYPAGGRVYVLANDAGNLVFDYALGTAATGLGASLATTSDGELVIGSPLAAPGRVYLVDNGSTSAIFQSTNGMQYFGDFLSTGDLDGDGADEIVVGAQSSNFVEVAGTGATIASSGTGSAWLIRPVGIGDLNGDGWNDLLMSRLRSTGAATVDVVMGNGSLSLSPTYAIDGGATQLAYDGLGVSGALTDLDGDGYVDVVLGSPFAGAGRAYTYVAEHGYGEHPWGNIFGPTQVVDQETALSTTACDGCLVNAWPDGTVCDLGLGGQVCVAESCVVRGCGDGWRETAASMVGREGCDDGNLVAGDACSSTCTPTILTVSSRELCEDAPSRFAPALAEDGAGDVLFVYTADEGELREVRARLFSSGGVPVEPDDELALVIAEVGLGWDPQATAVGLESGGWVVAWTSPNADGDGAGIAMRRVFMNGSLGPVSLLHSSDRLGAQLEPRLARLGDGFVVVWTDSSGTDGPLGQGIVMAQEYDAALARVGGSFAVSDPARWAGQPAVASTGAGWVVAWTDTPENPFEPASISARRYGSIADTAPFVVTADGASPSVATADDGSFLVAWVSRDTDWQGDIMTNTIAASGEPLGTPVAHALPGIQSAPTIAALAGGDYLVAYEEVGPRRGLAFGHIGAGTLAPESTALASYLVDGLQGDVSLLRTARGIWFAWSDASFDPDAYRSFLAFLLPLD